MEDALHVLPLVHPEQPVRSSRRKMVKSGPRTTELAGEWAFQQAGFRRSTLLGGMDLVPFSEM